jgi:hypothetical protein
MAELCDTSVQACCRIGAAYKNTAIGQNDALRRNICGICSDFDKRQSLSSGLKKQEFQRAFGVAVALLPRGLLMRPSRRCSTT